MSAGERKFRVWQGGLTGRYYAGWATPMKDGKVWAMTGERHDVTDDIERIIATHPSTERHVMILGIPPATASQVEFLMQRLGVDEHAAVYAAIDNCARDWGYFDVADPDDEPEPTSADEPRINWQARGHGFLDPGEVGPNGGPLRLIFNPDGSIGWVER